MCPLSPRSVEFQFPSPLAGEGQDEGEDQGRGVKRKIA